MARLFPNDYGAATLSAGEQAELETLETLRANQPDDYTVFHGVHWADEGRHGSAVGELDFVVVNQAGAILLVEQKADEHLQRAAGYTADDHRRLTAGKPTFDSIHRYKGQEAPAVILVDVDFPDWREERARRVLYTAMTRAGLHLCILHDAEVVR